MVWWTESPKQLLWSQGRIEHNDKRAFKWLIFIKFWSFEALTLLHRVAKYSIWSLMWSIIFAEDPIKCTSALHTACQIAINACSRATVSHKIWAFLLTLLHIYWIVAYSLAWHLGDLLGCSIVLLFGVCAWNSGHSHIKSIFHCQLSIPNKHVWCVRCLLSKLG